MRPHVIGRLRVVRQLEAGGLSPELSARQHHQTKHRELRRIERHPEIQRLPEGRRGFAGESMNQLKRKLQPVPLEMRNAFLEALETQAAIRCRESRRVGGL